MPIHTIDSHRIRRVDSVDPALAGALTDLVIDVVEGSASVGFMAPLSRDRALQFWTGCLSGAARGERILLVAEHLATGRVDGTVQVVLATPDNQPHRGDLAKMLVHRRARRTGLGTALLRAAETEARAAAKTLLVLNTATGSDAERLYSRLGWRRVGTIPDYALWPTGGYSSTTLFYRQLSDD